MGILWVPRDQLFPGSFLLKREEPWNEIVFTTVIFVLKYASKPEVVKMYAF
jgi:hypothetical protein